MTDPFMLESAQMRRLNMKIYNKLLKYVTVWAALMQEPS